MTLSAAQPAVVGRGIVVHRAGRPALATSDFQMPAAAVTSVIGPNGSGKTTLLHAIAGLIPLAAGTLAVLGTTPGDEPARVAYVLQATAVNDSLPISVREIVAMGRYASVGAYRRLGRPDHEAVEQAIDRMKIGDLQRRHLRELSGGQRQRVFVAQGLAQRADLLLLDEPLTGLDIPSHERIDDAIAEESRRGAAVVLTTHEIGEASRADHVLLVGGRVVASGRPAPTLTEANLAAAYGADLLHFEPSSAVVDDPHHLREAGTPPPPNRHERPYS